MGLFDKIFKKTSDQNKPEEHAVLLRLKLSDDNFGTEEERGQIHQLSDKLEEAINTNDVGEFDGDQFGGGECTLFMYGTDADKLYDAIEPILKSSPLTKGALVTKRYGQTTNLNAKEETFNL